MQHHGAMDDLEDVLRALLEERIEVKVGNAGADALRWRIMAVQAFCPKDGRQMERKASLLYLANGDWRKRDTFDVFMPADWTHPPEAYKQLVIDGLNKTLMVRTWRHKAERN